MILMYMKKIPLVRILTVLLLVNSQYLIAQHSIASFDAETGILRIPNLVFNDNIFDLIELRLNENGTLDVIGQTSAATLSSIPPDASFVFLDSNTVVIPVIESANEYFYNVELSITPESNLVVNGLQTQSDELLFREGEITIIESAIVVPSDIDSVVYPESYQHVSIAPVELVSPQCDLTPSTMVFPSSYLDDLGLPAIEGAPFEAEIELTVALKDFWLPNNPTFNQGCVGDAKDNFRLLIERAKSLHASNVEIVPWTFIDDRTSAWNILNTSELIEETGASVPTDEEIQWMVEVAHEAGIELHWGNQIQGNLASQIPDETEENMAMFLPAYEEFMLERASFLNSIGVDAMQVDCVCWFQFFEENEVTSMFFDFLENLIGEIDNRFDGELIVEQQTFYLDRPGIVNLADEFLLDLSARLDFSLEEAEMLNVDSVKQRALEAIQATFSIYPTELLDRSTILFAISSPSRNDFFSTFDSVEETFCTSGFNVISQQGDTCIQESMQANFSAQARVTEGILEALSEQTIVPNFRVHSQGYWLTQPILAGSTFPNIAFSARGKPAEKILQIWFDR